MTEPGFVAPIRPGWWPRRNRTGQNTNAYSFNVTAVGDRMSKGSASGSYGWVGTAVGGHPPATFVAASSSFGTSGTIPAHTVGQLIVLYIHSSNGSVPAKPAAAGTVPAWVDVDSSATGFGCGRTVRFKATATNHTTGTWANAYGMIAVVVDDQHPTSPIGGHAIHNAQNPSNAGTAPAITQQQTDGKALLLHFIGWNEGLGQVTAIAAAPSGYAQRIAARYDSNHLGLVLLTKNSTTTDGEVTQVITGGMWNIGATVEIKSG